MRAVERCLILVAALFLALGLRVEAAPQSSPKREAYSTSVNVEPGKAGGTYRFKAKVTRVVIADLRENTFYATIFVEREGEVLSIDARPSDSIALALRSKAPIYVNEDLLQPPPREDQAEAETSEEPARELSDQEKAEQLRRYLEKLNPEDFGKFQL